MNWYRKAAKEYEKLKDGEYYVSDFMKPKEAPIDMADFNTESKWIPIDSSFIEAVAYHKPLKMFEVKLKNGQEYSYVGVPSIVYTNFMKAKSKGEYFNRVVKKKYPFK